MIQPQPAVQSASIGPLITILFFLGASLAKWLIRNSSAQDHPTATGKPRSFGTPPSTPAEEAETRKFLEALGLPPDGAHRPIPPRTPRPPIDRPPRLPVKPAWPVARQNWPKQPGHRRVLPPIPQPRPPFGSTTVLERIEMPHVPELRMPELPNFHTKSSDVSAIPYETKGVLPMSLAETAAGEQGSHPSVEIRNLLHSPGALRNAFLLREILGPPRGLQSGNFPPTFASL